LRKLRWYTSDVVARAAMACCAMDNAWLAVASARAATAHASQGGGAAQAPSSNNGVPSASTRASVTEVCRLSLVIPYLSSQGGDRPASGDAPWLLLGSLRPIGEQVLYRCRRAFNLKGSGKFPPFN
jgi:hypothetical protein